MKQAIKLSKKSPFKYKSLDSRVKKKIDVENVEDIAEKEQNSPSDLDLSTIDIRNSDAEVLNDDKELLELLEALDKILGKKEFSLSTTTSTPDKKQNLSVPVIKLMYEESKQKEGNNKDVSKKQESKNTEKHKQGVEKREGSNPSSLEKRQDESSSKHKESVKQLAGISAENKKLEGNIYDVLFLEGEKFFRKLSEHYGSDVLPAEYRFEFVKIILLWLKDNQHSIRTIQEEIEKAKESKVAQEEILEEKYGPIIKKLIRDIYENLINIKDQKVKNILISSIEDVINQKFTKDMNDNYDEYEVATDYSNKLLKHLKQFKWNTNRVEDDLREIEYYLALFQKEEQGSVAKITKIAKDINIVVCDIKFEVEIDEKMYVISFPVYTGSNLADFSKVTEEVKAKVDKEISSQYSKLKESAEHVSKEKKVSRGKESSLQETIGEENIRALDTYHSEKALYANLFADVEKQAKSNIVKALEVRVKALPTAKSKNPIDIKQVSIDMFSTRDVCERCTVLLGQQWQDVIDKISSGLKELDVDNTVSAIGIDKNVVFTQKYNEAALSGNILSKCKIDHDNPRVWFSPEFLKDRYEQQEGSNKQYYVSEKRTFFISDKYNLAQKIKKEKAENQAVNIEEKLDVADMLEVYFSLQGLDTEVLKSVGTSDELRENIRSSLENLEASTGEIVLPLSVHPIYKNLTNNPDALKVALIITKKEDKKYSAYYVDPTGHLASKEVLAVIYQELKNKEVSADVEYLFEDENMLYIEYPGDVAKVKSSGLQKVKLHKKNPSDFDTWSFGNETQENNAAYLIYLVISLLQNKDSQWDEVQSYWNNLKKSINLKSSTILGKVLKARFMSYEEFERINEKAQELINIKEERVLDEILNLGSTSDQDVEKGFLMQKFLDTQERIVTKINEENELKRDIAVQLIQNRFVKFPKALKELKATKDVEKFKEVDSKLISAVSQFKKLFHQKIIIPKAPNPYNQQKSLDYEYTEEDIKAVGEQLFKDTQSAGIEWGGIIDTNELPEIGSKQAIVGIHNTGTKENPHWVVLVVTENEILSNERIDIPNLQKGLIEIHEKLTSSASISTVDSAIFALEYAVQIASELSKSTVPSAIRLEKKNVEELRVEFGNLYAQSVREQVQNEGIVKALGEALGENEQIQDFGVDIAVKTENIESEDNEKNIVFLRLIDNEHIQIIISKKIKGAKGIKKVVETELKKFFPSLTDFTQETLVARLSEVNTAVFNVEEARVQLGDIEQQVKEKLGDLHQAKLAFFQNQTSPVQDQQSEEQAVAEKMKKLSAAGNDATLGGLGKNDPYYWYSMMDVTFLLRDIRKGFAYTSLPPVEGEEFSALRENQERTLVTDPYYMDSFDVFLLDTISRITGISEGQEANTENPQMWKWQQMPTTIIIPLLENVHWRNIRVKIDYEERAINILWDDPYGSEGFSANAKQIIKTSLLTHLQKVFQVHFNNQEQYELTINEVEKEVDQQGRGDNGWDCGPIVLSNIRDYVKEENRDRDIFIGETNFTIKQHDAQVSTQILLETRAYDIEVYDRITQDEAEAINSRQEILGALQANIKTELSNYSQYKKTIEEALDFLGIKYMPLDAKGVSLFFLVLDNYRYLMKIPKEKELSMEQLQEVYTNFSKFIQSDKELQEHSSMLMEERKNEDIGEVQGQIPNQQVEKNIVSKIDIKHQNDEMFIKTDQKLQNIGQGRQRGNKELTQEEQATLASNAEALEKIRGEMLGQGENKRFKGNTGLEGMKKEEIEGNLKLVTQLNKLRNLDKNLHIESCVLKKGNIVEKLISWIEQGKQKHYGTIIKLKNEQDNKHAIVLYATKVEDSIEIKIIDPLDREDSKFTLQMEKLAEELSLVTNEIEQIYSGRQYKDDATCGDISLIMLQELCEAQLQSKETGQQMEDNTQNTLDLKVITPDGKELSDSLLGMDIYGEKLQAQLIHYYQTGELFETARQALGQGFQVIGTEQISQFTALTNIYQSIRDNNINSLRIIVEQGTDILQYDENNQTPLQIAVSTSNVAAARLLLESYVPITNVEHEIFNLRLFPNGIVINTVLHIAVEQGDEEMVRLLVEYGANGVRWNANADTAIHLAADLENPNITITLLNEVQEEGLINLPDANGFTALDRAIGQGNTKTAITLIEYGGSVSVSGMEREIDEVLNIVYEQNANVDLIEGHLIANDVIVNDVTESGRYFDFEMPELSLDFESMIGNCIVLD